MHDDWSTLFAQQHHSHHSNHHLYESAAASAADLLPLLIFESNNTNNNGTHIESSHVSISANALFVVMSYFISILGAFTAFQLVNEMRYVKSKIKRFIFIVCASISMSICAIWSMHFVGTVCFNHHNMGEHLEITYDVTLTVMSAVVPFFACLFGFLCTTIQLFIPKFRLVTLFPLSLCFPDYVSKTQDSITSTQDETMTDVLGENVGKKKKRNFISKLRRFAVHSVLGNEFRPHIIQILIGALFAATGICGMHYMGMLATQVDGTIRTWNGGIIFASVVIAYLASCAAFWVAFAVRNEYQQIASSLIAAVAVSGMHYCGMASVTYHRVHVTTERSGVTISNYDMTMVVSMLTSATCFLMLIIASFSSRTRSRDLRKSLRQVDQEKRKVQSSMDQLNDLFTRMAAEEHLTRKILNLLSGGVCVINKQGQITKANQAFDKMCSITDSDNRGCIQQYLVGVTDVERQLFCKEEAAEKTVVSIKNPFSGDSHTNIHMRRTIANENNQYCILMFDEYTSQAGQTSTDNINLTPLTNKDEPSLNRVNLLDKCLNDESLFGEFKAFCESEMCAENLEFLEKTKQYKSCANVLERVQIQYDILSLFVQPGSKKQLNLPITSLNQAASQIEQAYGQTDLFDSLENQVKLILADSYFRFTKL